MHTTSGAIKGTESNGCHHLQPLLIESALFGTIMNN